jgi:hypothetical protein
MPQRFEMPSCQSALARLDLFGQLRKDSEQVADHAEVDQLEERRLGVPRTISEKVTHSGATMPAAGAVLDSCFEVLLIVNR